MWEPMKGIDDLEKMFELGKIVPIIDQCYPLNETAKSFRHIGEGHAKSKVVVTVNQ